MRPIYKVAIILTADRGVTVQKTMQVNCRSALDELVKASEDAGGYDL
jgi:hypothetical protein